MANGEFGGGNGTREDPYLVEDAMDLDAVREDLTASYLQVADIDLGSWGNWTPIAFQEPDSWDRVFFQGSYDGGGFNISNMTCEHPDATYVGLFGEVIPYILNESDDYDDWVTVNPELKNIHILNSIVSGGSDTGGIAGFIQGLKGNALLLRCSFSGEVSGEYVGGLVGYSVGCDVRECYSSVLIHGGSYSGGIVGISESEFVIENCSSDAVITSDGGAGGLIGGSASFVTIKRCLTSGSIKSEGGENGGIIGHSSAYDYESDTEDGPACVIAECFSLLDSISVPNESSANLSGSLIGNLGGAHATTSCFTIDTFSLLVSDGEVPIDSGIQSLVISDNLSRLPSTYTMESEVYSGWMEGDARLVKVKDPYNGFDYEYDRIVRIDSDEFYHDPDSDYIIHDDVEPWPTHVSYSINNIGEISIPGYEVSGSFIYIGFDLYESNFDLLYKDGSVAIPSTNHDFSQYSPATATYWDFGKVWGIEEGVTRPFLIRSDMSSDETAPATTRGSLVRVKRDNDGSMFFDGVVYKYMESLSYTQEIDQSFFSQSNFVLVQLLSEEKDFRSLHLISSSKPLIFDLGVGSVVASNSRDEKFDAYTAFVHPEDGEVVRLETPRGVEGVVEHELLTSSGDYSPTVILDSNYDVYDETGSLLYVADDEFSPLRYYDVHALEADGEEATFSFYGASVTDLEDDAVLMFIASSVEDPEYPGGYGSYEATTTRTAQYLEERSNKVNFYYVKATLPDYDYLIKVASGSGNIPIVLLNDKPSFIRCATHDGSITNVSLVEVDSSTASPIKVMTPDGMMALEALTLEV